MFDKLSSCFPVLKKRIVRALVLIGASIVAKAAFAENLLHGDPSFEAGLNGWIAISAPRKFDYMSNRYFKFRNNGDIKLPIIEIKNAPHGDRVLELESHANFENHVTGSPVLLQAGKEAKFSAFIRCSTPAMLTQGVLRESKRRKKNSFNSLFSYNRVKVSMEWKQYKLPFRPDITGKYIPNLKIEGNSVCQFDALLLTTSQNSSHYVPPQPVTLAILDQVHSKYRTPNLFTSNLDDPHIVSIALYNNSSSPTSGRLSLLVTDPYGISIATDTVDLTLHEKRHQVQKFSLQLPEVGTWKLDSEFTPFSSHGNLSQADATITKMRVVDTERPDPFFGAHEKWNPLIEAMGFGSIRDLNMMRWIDVQPAPGQWKEPDSEELALIDSYIDRGGHYLVTLVAEAPYQNPWSKKTWGKKRYGPIPLWAGASTDTEGGMFGKFSRKLKNEAISQYISAVSSHHPDFELEFMNEPNHYMTSSEYLQAFISANNALRESKSRQPLIALSTPPTYPYLAGGRRNLAKPQPYKWIQEFVSHAGPNNLSTIGLHTYGRYRRKEVPETSYGGIGEADWAKGVAQIRGAENSSIWITEKGISTIPWKKSMRIDSKATDNRVDSPLTQARWIIRAQIDARIKGIKRYYVFNRIWSKMAHDRYLPRGDQAYTFFEVDGQPLPLLVAQRVLIEQLSHTQPVKEENLSSIIRYALFQHKDTKHLIGVIWAYGKDQHSEVRLEKQELSCPPPISNAKAIGMFGEMTGSACDNGVFSVTPSPVYLVFPKKLSVNHATTALNGMSPL